MFKRADLEKMATVLGGVLVGHTSADGLAARAGLWQGDIIVRANGMPTPDLTALMRARSRQRERATLELYRYGQKLTIEVIFETPRARDVMRQSTPFRSPSASLPPVRLYQ